MVETVRPFVAGNWKMNGARAMTRSLIGGLVDRIARGEEPVCDMLVCPPSPFLVEAADALSGVTAISLGAQDCHVAVSGAHTGDIAAPMLADVGCTHVIVGHSERRSEHGESDALVKTKGEAALAAGLCAIVCIGETLADRDAGQAADVVTDQLRASLPDGATVANTVIAYEPVWAIGTGRTPTNDDIANIHGEIRNVLRKRMSEGASVRILYGGSVKPENAASILGVADVNGALVGGASLDVDDFWAICRSCR